MGYETKLLVVSNSKNKFIGYCRVEASLELGCICYDNLGDLINKLQEKDRKDLHEKIQNLEDETKRIFPDGNYSQEVRALSEKERKKQVAKLFSLRQELEKELPYIYDGDEEAFTDSYGNTLLVADLEEVITAILKDNAKAITANEYPFGYRRFNIALALLEQFRIEKFGQKVKVVLFGH